jgi:perosamine synthetase
LGDIDGITLPISKTNFAKNDYWVFGIVLKAAHDLNAKAAMQILKDEGIGTRPFFCPMHLQPVLRNLGLFNKESYPISEHMYEKGFYIPSGLGLSLSDMHVVSKAVRNTLI